MFRNRILVFALVVVLMALALPAGPARAVNAASVEAFHATCSNFSVDVTLTGVTDDQAGFDRFRYQVTDGTGKVLYTEDTARQVGVSERVFVVNLAYDADGVRAGPPEANPITFAVIDLDILARPVGLLRQVTFNSACLAPTAEPTHLIDLLPRGIVGHMLAESTLYTAPGGAPLDLSVPRGREFTALYRSADNAWVGIYVGGENLVWVPAGNIDVPLNSLPFLPTQIDRSQQVTGAIVPGVPVTVAYLNYTLRFRAGPSLRASIIGRVPWKSVVPVYGRSADSNWVFILYNGVGGWISSWYIRLYDVPLRSLPVVG